MRMAELSKRSGIGVSTIKFYLREGLLPSGERTQANQAQYDDGHLARLQLIRALSEVGRLSLAEIGRVLEAADSESRPIDALTVLSDTVTTECTYDAPRERAEETLRESFRRRGLEPPVESPAYAAAVNALGSLSVIEGGEPTEAQLDAFLEAAGTIVEKDGLRRIRESASTDPGGKENDKHRILIGAMRRDQFLSALVVLATEAQLDRSAS